MKIIFQPQRTQKITQGTQKVMTENESSTDNYSVLCVTLCVLCGKKTLRILKKPKSRRTYLYRQRQCRYDC